MAVVFGAGVARVVADVVGSWSSVVVRSVGGVTDPSRLARLHAVKLAALVRDHGVVDAVPHDFAGGAALTVHAAGHGTGLEPGHEPGPEPGRDGGQGGGQGGGQDGGQDGDRADGPAGAGDEVWVLLADRPGHGLGGALAWALRRHASRVHVVADEGTGTLARRAAGFSMPVSVWQVDGRALRPAVAEPLPVAPPVPATHLGFEAMIVAAGADPVVEHGVLAGEVAGLEVCRVVDDPFTGAVRLEVGVGAHDREAFQMLHGDRPTAEALAHVVRSVTQHRLHDVHGHPLARLAKERLLRDRLRWNPALVGATSVEPTAPPVPRTNLKDAVPCAAIAEVHGERVLVVCSAGIDLEAVPWAVDARTASGLDRCVLALPARDAIAVQRRLAEAAAPPITVVAIADAATDSDTDHGTGNGTGSTTAGGSGSAGGPVDPPSDRPPVA